MAKTFKKSLAMLIVALMTVGMFAPQALAAETTTTTDTQTTTEGGVTTTVTTTTETTVDGETTTVVVTIDTAKAGTDETGAEVNYNETTTETTVTTNEPDGSVTETESFVEDGSETLEWDEIPEEEDLPEYVVLPEIESPEVEVEIIPGDSNPGSASVTESETNTDENGTTETTVTIDKDVTVDASDVEVKMEESSTDLESIAPENYEGKSDWAVTGVYGVNGKNFDLFIDGDNVPYSGKEGYDYQYTGAADTADQPFRVDVLSVTYKRDPVTNEPLVDEDGNYIIESVSSINTATGGIYNSYKDGYPTQVKIFVLTKYTEDGEVESRHFAYCLDADTPTEHGAWYKVSNLEDSDYYPDEESEDHLRAIALNGYWGTEEGIGSVDQIRDNMMLTYDEDDTITVTDANGAEHTYNVLDILASLNEGEALAATQAAIWSYSNGSIGVQDGSDGTIINDTFYYATISHKDFPVVELERKARMVLMYRWLMGLEQDADAPVTTIINDENFIEDVTLTVGEQVDEIETTDANGDTVTNGVYDTALSFTLAFIPGEKDDLLMQLTYTDLDGNEQIIVKRLGTENSVDTIAPAEDGSYTISGLKLSENEDFNFDLRLEGTQHLEHGVYIYQASGGSEASQTMVGIAEGTQEVSVSASMTVSFSVDEEEHVVAERTWHNEEDPTTTVTPPPPPPQDDNPPEEEEELPPPPEERLTPPAEEIIPDEEVPLAEVPYTGDDSAMWLLVIGPAGLGLAALNLSDKKRKEDEI